MKIRRLFIIIMSVLLLAALVFFVIIPIVFHNRFINTYCTLKQADGRLEHITFNEKGYTFAVSEYDWNTGYGDLHFAASTYYDGNTNEKLSIDESIVVRMTPYSGNKAASIKVRLEYKNSEGELVKDTVYFDNELNLQNKDSITNTERYMLKHNLERIEKLLMRFHEQWPVFELKKLIYDDLVED